MSPFEASPTNVMVLMAIVKTIIALLGGVITYYAAKAYRRTHDRSLGLLAVGFGTVTVGAIFGGISFEMLGVTLETGVLIEGVFIAIGFLLIAYSLRVPSHE